MFKKLLPAILAALASFLITTPALGYANTPPISVTYNNRIIDDPLFINSGSMSVNDIQNFLNGKVPACDTNHVGGDPGQPPPYVCLKDYVDPTTGKKAAQLIFDEATTLGLNPQVILVTLQKEQGLVTDSWPYPSQYKSAMGYGCPESQSVCDSAYYGLYNQVHLGTKLLRVGYDRDCGNMSSFGGQTSWFIDPKWRLNNTPAVSNTDGRATQMQTCSTGSLYNYTPHRPDSAYTLSQVYRSDGTPALNPDGSSVLSYFYGNYNFISYFTNWFGPTNLPHLIRTSSSPTVYLLTDGRRYSVPNGDILYAYGLQTLPVGVVSDSLLSNITDGGLLSTIFTVPNDPTVYLADGGKKYGISSATYCTMWGLSCGDTSVQKEIDSAMFDGMGVGGVLGSVMSNQGTVFLMEGGNKRPFLSLKSITDHGYSLASVIPIVNWTNAIRSIGFSLPEEDSFVKFGSSASIYAFANDKFYSITSFDAFKNWSSSATPLALDQASQYNSQPPSASGALPNIVTTPDSKEYLVDGGRRIDITQVSGGWPAGTAVGDLTTLMSRLPVNASATSQTTYRQPNGAIYRVTAQEKHPFNSLRDYFDLGYGSQPGIQLFSPNLPLNLGSTVFSEGSAFKIAGSDTIFMVASGGGTFGLARLSQLQDFSINPVIPVIPTTDASQFTFTGPLASLAVSSSGNYFAITSSGRLQLPTSVISLWGFVTSGAISLSDISLGRINASSITPTFFVSPNGTIYFGESGTKRPIGSFLSYKNLGGNATNTITMPQDILDLAPDGSVYP